MDILKLHTLSRKLVTITEKLLHIQHLRKILQYPQSEVLVKGGNEGAHVSDEDVGIKKILREALDNSEIGGTVEAADILQSLTALLPPARSAKPSPKIELGMSKTVLFNNREITQTLHLLYTLELNNYYLGVVVTEVPDALTPSDDWGQYISQVFPGIKIFVRKVETFTKAEIEAWKEKSQEETA